MKYIPKYQGGGGFTATFSPPLQSPSGVSQTSPTQQTAQQGITPSDLLSKEVIKELILKGNQNDVNSFLNDFADYNQSINMMGGTDIFNRTSLYKLASKANQIISNHEFLKQAINEASSRNALQEVALDSHGNMYVQDEKGNINTMTIDKYDQVKDKVVPLTNSDLINLRKNDPRFAFDTHLTSVIQNGVGSDKVNQQIFDIIDKFGTISSKKTTYVDKSDLAVSLNNPNIKDPNSSAQQGLAQLADAYKSMGVDGVYKIIQEQSTNREPTVVKNACAYIYSMLPQNSKNLLKAKSSMGGLGTNPMNLIGAAMTIGTEVKSNTDLEYQRNLSKSGVETTGKEGKTNEMTFGEKWLMGSTDLSHDFILNDPENSKWSMRLLGNASGGFPGKSMNDVAPPMPILTLLSNTAVSPAIDKNNIYFGNKKVNPYELKNYWYNGDQTAIVWMPTNSDGTINFQSLTNMQRASDYIKNNHLKDIGQINEIYRRMGAGFYQLNSAGKQVPNTENVKPFAAVHVYTSGQAEAVANNSFTTELSGDKNSKMKDYLTNGFKNFKMKYPSTFFGDDDVYSGIMFMPINKSAAHDITTLAGNGPVTQKMTESDMMIKDMPHTEINTSSSALYN